jgi:hypothetical protein
MGEKVGRLSAFAGTLTLLIIAGLGAPPPVLAQSNYVDPFTLANRGPAKAYERFGDLPLGAVLRTDERYGADPLFQGPRGWDYWNRLENPKGDQNTNLWPDKRPTYLIAQMVMPVGSSISARAKFPHARYFNLSLCKFEHDTFVAVAGESLDGWEIEPDPGSTNPFRVGAERLTATILRSTSSPRTRPRTRRVVHPTLSMSAATANNCSWRSASTCRIRAMTAWAGAQPIRPRRSRALRMRAGSPTGPGFPPRKPRNGLAGRSALPRR